MNCHGDASDQEVVRLRGSFFSAASLMGKNFGEIDYEHIPLAVGIATVTVVATVGSLVWNIIKVNKKKKIVAAATRKNLPVIEWEAVQYLLDEQ